MSHHQPGPYGGQPRRPGPYDQPGPHDRQPQAPQPGHDHPQRTPEPRQDVPPPRSPPLGGGTRKAGWIVGAAAVVAAIGVGAYLMTGGGGDVGGLKDDGPHVLSAPKTVLGEYTRVGEGSEDSSPGTTEDLAKGGVKDGRSVGAQYSTADFGDYDPASPDPADIPGQDELLKAKGMTFFGAYGEVEDPEAAVDGLFANIGKETEENPSNELMSELVGRPEAADIDGAVMKCQAGKGHNSLTQKETTNWFCVWADHSTVVVVSPGDNTQDITKDTAVDIATRLRDEVRVPT